MLNLNQKSPLLLLQNLLPLSSLEDLPVSGLLPLSCTSPATSHVLDPVPWLRPGVHCTYYSRHPVIYFSSELIVKSIRSREKTLTQACHEKQGNRGSFPSQPVHPGKAGGRKMLPHLVFRRQKLPSSVEGTWCSGPIFLLRVFSLIPLDKNLSFRNPLWV